MTCATSPWTDSKDAALFQRFFPFYYPGISKHCTGQAFTFSKDSGAETGFVSHEQQEEGMPWPSGKWW